jgi:hypothetical protein
VYRNTGQGGAYARYLQTRRRSTGATWQPMFDLKCHRYQQRHHSTGAVASVLVLQFL